jgi:catechol 2,3-dioxygenase-like lactoylglutathione lyase family enzyme
MPITELNHYFVRSKNLERSRHFYCDILGFEEMPRPDFPFPGYWLGVNGKIQVHMGQDGVADADVYYLGTTAQSARNNSGVVDHIAFMATEPEKFAQRFDRAGLVSRHRYIAPIQLFQIFVTDPDGLTIELNFPDVAVEPAWAKTSERR